jgi:hypothetical protein
MKDFLKKSYLCFLILFCFLIFGKNYKIFAQKAPKLVKTKVSEKIQVKLPDDFIVMSPDMYAKKYGAYRSPIGIYTNKVTQDADFGVNEAVNRSLLAHSNAEWEEKDMLMLKDIYKGSIKAMHDQVEFLQDKINIIQKRKFITLEFVASVKDEEGKISMRSKEKKQYSYIQYTVEQGKILIFNFNCPANRRNLYQPVAQEIMQSIKIKN